MSNSVGRNDNFLAKARKLSIRPTSLDIFDRPIRQHYKAKKYSFLQTSLDNFDIRQHYTYSLSLFVSKCILIPTLFTFRSYCSFKHMEYLVVL